MISDSFRVHRPANLEYTDLQLLYTETRMISRDCKAEEDGGSLAVKSLFLQYFPETSSDVPVVTGQFLH